MKHKTPRGITKRCGRAGAAWRGGAGRGRHLVLLLSWLAGPRGRGGASAARRSRQPPAMELLIAAVRQYPCLWNTTAIEYRDQELKDAAWTEVMKEAGLQSVKEVKLKWKKLRDSYRDALKRQSEMLARDPAPGKRACPWKYMGLMQFLQPHMNNRKKILDATQPAPTENGQSQNGGDASSEESSSEAESSPKRKSDQLTGIDRKLDYLCKSASKRPCLSPDRRAPAPAPDPLDIFFNSMCQSVKRLPYPTQIKIKKILFNAVVEAEEALLAEQANYASLWAAEAGSSSSSEAEEEDQKAS
ncbi:hypothetical protein JYU34_002051 [Plutella xylostella]|uniref:MADF domain-containing protein n=2 Tax=Plutella xylostella TaxID=51655 RepID=A0ABQ7R5J7_PLUXY|nr:hypothetical protein JYU34_002051 [Plutella xylostella]